MLRPWSILFCALSLMSFTVGCSAKEAPAPTQQQAQPQPSTPVQEKKNMANFSEPKQSQVDPSKTYEALIKTDKGEIRIRLMAKEAPLGVTNFIQLSKGGFYDGLTFHRVEPGFVVQGGDPSGNGTGGPGYTIPAEIGPAHIEGAVAWARTGDQVNPERRSSGSQFYITLAPTPFLDGAYSVFGETVAGSDVVKSIRRGDKIQSIEILEK